MSWKPNCLAGRVGEGPPIAPIGWRWSAGTRVQDMCFIAPSGHRFYSRVQLTKYLNTLPHPPPLEAFKWRNYPDDFHGSPLPGDPRPTKESKNSTNASPADKKSRGTQQQQREHIRPDVPTPAKKSVEKAKTPRKAKNSPNAYEEHYLRLLNPTRCQKCEGGASYYLIPTELQQLWQKETKISQFDEDGIEDSYYLTDEEIAIIHYKKPPNKKTRLTKIMGPEEANLNNDHFVVAPHFDFYISEKDPHIQALLDIEEERFEISRLLEWAKSTIEMLKSFINCLQVEMGKGKEEFMADINDFLKEHTLKKIMKECCGTFITINEELKAKPYYTSLKILKCLEEKLKEYQEVHKENESKLEEHSKMLKLEAQVKIHQSIVSSLYPLGRHISKLKYHNKNKNVDNRDFDVKNFLTEREINRIKEVYVEGGSQIVNQLKMEPSKICPMIIDKLLHAIKEMQKELKKLSREEIQNSRRKRRKQL